MIYTYTILYNHIQTDLLRNGSGLGKIIAAYSDRDLIRTAGTSHVEEKRHSHMYVYIYNIIYICTYIRLLSSLLLYVIHIYIYTYIYNVRYIFFLQQVPNVQFFCLCHARYARQFLHIHTEPGHHNPGEKTRTYVLKPLYQRL